LLDQGSAQVPTFQEQRYSFMGLYISRASLYSVLASVVRAPRDAFVTIERFQIEYQYRIPDPDRGPRVQRA